MSAVCRALFLFALSVFAAAQPQTYRVRLFWQHPPEDIQIVPDGASLRECRACPPLHLDQPLQVTARESKVIAGRVASSTILLNGRLRISGSGFSPFVAENELLLQARDGFLLLTLTMTLEQYVSAVLQGECAGFKSDEAMKAMAVAARTYAVRFRSRHPLEDFDFCDTTHCQDLRLGNPSSRARAAAVATEGELLWFEGRPAATYYHRSCGGEIEEASALEPDLHVPYLRRHHDDYCIRTPDEWQAEITKEDISRALGHPARTVTVYERSPSGRVRSLLVNGYPMNATDFRLAIGRTLGWEKLRSDLYQEQDLGDALSFRGRGQGHGVGLCQAGADSMGEQGRSYRQILAFYYPETTVGVTAQGLAWEKLPGETVDVITTNRDDAAMLLPSAERALAFALQATGWDINARPQIKVYPTVAIFRDATGEPGWVAASTRGAVIRIQPIHTLRQAGALDATLRHEFLHLVIESKADPNTPLWLREGLAIYLSNPAAAKPAGSGKIDLEALERRLQSLKTESEMRAAYRDCGAAAANAVEKNGVSTVLSWITAKR